MSVIAEQLATVAIEKVKERQEAKANQELAKTIINALSNKIDQTKQQIIEEIQFQNIRNLHGKIAGLGISLKDYASMPNSNFFDEILSRSGEILGELKVIVEDTNKFKEGKTAYPLYIIANSIRRLLLEDYKHRYSSSDAQTSQINNNLKSFLNESLVITDKLIDKALETESNRFSEIITVLGEVEGLYRIWYKFDGDRYAGETMTIPPTFLNNPKYLQVARKRKNHMEKVLTNDYDDIFFKPKEKLLIQRNVLSLHALWSSGWTSFVPFIVNGKQYLFLHKDSNNDNVRKTAIEEIHSDLKGTSEVWAGQWSRGLTSFVLLKKNQTNYIFSYKIDGSKTAIDEINSNLDMTEQWTAAWSYGYTNFAPFIMNGNNYLLGYKLDTGKVFIEKINLSGSSTDTEEVWADRWTPIGWTSIVLFKLNQHPHLLLYKLFEGKVEIHKVNPNGEGTSQLWNSNWSKGWTSIVPFEYNQLPHVLLYKSWSGETFISKVNANGQGLTDIKHFNWTPGWTTIVQFEANGETHLFMYKITAATIGISSIKNLL